ncbi:MAG TPA: M28 family peptidase [Longimicrobiales bacterium]|nr:M28 family peptidase [Longimicrobiales bacterium]
MISSVKYCLAVTVLVAACAPSNASLEAPPLAAASIDSVRLLRDIGVLAHDSMEGRLVGTPGNARARAFIERSFRERGLQPVGGTSYLHPFNIERNNTTIEGVNIVGQVTGTTQPSQYIVVTAHYDHVGVRDGEIYNGADDNASGTAALLAMADYFTRNRPRHTLIFAALDAEEGGLRGARAFVENPPVPLESIVLNINMDMVGRNDAGELYVAGTAHYPQLLPFVEEVARNAEVTLIPGHDRPGARPSDDWTTASDHAAFHRAGIPFLYFGVEDHPDYHRPTDELSGIQPGFYPRAVRTVLAAVRLLDREYR